MRKTIGGLVAAFLFLATAGCAQFQSVLKTVEQSDIGVRIATAEYIGGDIATAERVSALAAEALSRVDETVTIRFDRLAEQADAMIPWHRMSPGQRILAEELFLAAQRKLEEMVISGELSPDGVASLRSILRTIQKTAEREISIARARALIERIPGFDPVEVDFAVSILRERMT